MHYIVCGGSGFIGSNFIRMLLKNNNDEKIINVDKMTYAANLLTIKNFENYKNYSFYKYDIKDCDAMKSIINEGDIVINFAAESHVDNSINNPSVFLETNVLGVQSLLSACKDKKASLFLQCSCYDTETRVLTPDGFKTYDQIKIGDKILSLNIATKYLEEKVVDEVVIQDYSGKMYHFNYARTDLMVTPNHRMLFEDEYGNIQCKTAEESASKTYQYKLPKAKWAGINNDIIDIPGFGSVLTEDLFYLCGLFIGDGLVNRQIQKRKNKSGLKRKEFLVSCRNSSGRFESKGKIGKEEYYECVCNRIWFAIPPSDCAFSKMCAVLDKLGISYTSNRKGTSSELIYFSSEPLLRWFEQFGKHAKNKHIPKWMLQYDVKYLKKLYEGLIDSDGRDAITCVYSTCSESLVRDMCELGIKLGYFPHFTKRYTESWYAKENRWIKGIGYKISFCITHPNFKKYYLKIKNYNSKVWCLKVRDNRNLIVERNGKIAICGNTDEVYGSLSIDQSSSVETDMLCPSSPYSASKAAAEMLCFSYMKTFGLPIIITRSSNNFGPYQFPEKIIPLFITNIIQNKKVPIYGNGQNIRDWIFVEDNCDAIRFLIENGSIGEVYNIGGGNELTNLDLTYSILSKMNWDESGISFVADRLGHDLRYSLNCSKLKSLGWKPKNIFDVSLSKTIEWYINNVDWWKHLVK